jgi:pilus assembly protein CpaF
MVAVEEPAGPGTEGEFLETVRRRLMSAYPDLLARARLDERGRESVRRAVRQILVADGRITDRSRREELVSRLFEEIAGYGPLEPLLSDPLVSEVMVNGAKRVYVEREGRLERTGVSFRDDAHVLEVVARMVGGSGRRVDFSQPYVDARLPDGSRVNAIIPPVALDGPILTVRRFGHGPTTPDDLVRMGTLTEFQAMAVRRAVSGRLNVLVSGGAGSGKTTFLNALAAFISLERERVITIEDAAELRFGDGNLVRLECRPPNIEGKGGVNQRQLLRNALRMRPDRIIVGECRGDEAFDMLQAMNTGHPGSMTTVHANSPADALRRLEIMVLLAGEGLPHSAARDHIASAVDVIVHLVRLPAGSRMVSEICVVRSCDQSSGAYDLAPAVTFPDGTVHLPLTGEQVERLRLFEGGEGL